jgi:hypothetical protein
MLSFAGLNVWALLVTTFLGFVLGGVWYSPLAFGRRWLTAIGKTERELGSPVRPMLITLLSSFVTSTLLATLNTRPGIPHLGCRVHARATG